MCVCVSVQQTGSGGIVFVCVRMYSSRGMVESCLCVCVHVQQPRNGGKLFVCVCVCVCVQQPRNGGKLFVCVCMYSSRGMVESSLGVWVRVHEPDRIGRRQN